MTAVKVVSKLLRFNGFRAVGLWFEGPGGRGFHRLEAFADGDDRQRLHFQLPLSLTAPQEADEMEVGLHPQVWLWRT